MSLDEFQMTKNYFSFLHYDTNVIWDTHPENCRDALTKEYYLTDFKLAFHITGSIVIKISKLL